MLRQYEGLPREHRKTHRNSHSAFLRAEQTGKLMPPGGSPGEHPLRS